VARREQRLSDAAAGTGSQRPPFRCHAARRTLSGILSIGPLITAIFPPDRMGTPSTRSGDIHDIRFLVNVVSILLASGLLSAGFGSDARWRAFQRTAVTLASLLVLASVLQRLEHVAM